MKYYGDADGDTITLTISLGIGVALGAVLTIVTVVNLYFLDEKSADLNKKIKHASGLGSMFFLLSSIMTLAFTINCQTDTLTQDMRNSIHGLSIVMWSFGKTLLWFVFIHRLYITFEQTPDLALPKFCFYIFYFILSLIILLTGLIIALLYGLDQLEMFFYLAAAGSPIDIAISLVLFRLFQVNLQKLVVDRSYFSKASVFDDQDQVLLKMISKLFFLTAMGVIYSVSLGVVLVIRAFDINYAEMRMVYLCFMFWGWNATANTAVIYFSLSFSADIYRKLFRHPQRCLEQLCSKRSHKQLQSRRLKTPDPPRPSQMETTLTLSQIKSGRLHGTSKTNSRLTGTTDSIVSAGMDLEAIASISPAPSTGGGQPQQPTTPLPEPESSLPSSQPSQE